MHLPFDSPPPVLSGASADESYFTPRARIRLVRHSIDRGDAPQDAFLTMLPKHFMMEPSQAMIKSMEVEEEREHWQRLAAKMRDLRPRSDADGGQVLRAVIAEGLGWGAPGKEFVLGLKSWSGCIGMNVLADATRVGGDETLGVVGAILIHPAWDTCKVPPKQVLDRVPTILGWAKDDSKVPYSMAGRFDSVDSVELVTFERGGHHAFDGSGGLPNFDDSIDAWYRKHFLSQDDGLLIGVDGQLREQEVLGRDIVGARGRVGADAADLAAGAVTEVDGRVLTSLIVAGFARLSSRADELNAINVFPVADKDTGVNMKVCLKVPARNLLLEPSSSVLVVSSNMAADVLLHGQGNSGTILSHFFISLAEELAALGRRHAVSIGELASCLAATGGKMADAVSDPKEGTIVSVARDSCASLAGGQSYATLLELLEAWWASCAAALAMTPEQLIVDGVNVLEKAGVVDSGAQGFCYMVEGMLLACRGELDGAGDASVFASGSVAREEESIAETYADDHSVASAYQYCTVRIGEIRCIIHHHRLDLTCD